MQRLPEAIPPCPSCASPSFSLNGSYFRQLVSYYKGAVRCGRISVRSLMCSSCRKSHALILSILIPPSSFLLLPDLCCFEAQYLNSDILRDLKMLCNFCMDSQNCFSLILLGQPVLTGLMMRQPNEALRQRIAVSYGFAGLSEDEARDYIRDQMELSGVAPHILMKMRSRPLMEAAIPPCASLTSS